MLLQSEFFFMPPGTEGFAPHQDDFYVKSEDKDAFISLWFPLIDVNQNNGCIRIWGKTHKLGILDVIVRENTNVKNVDKNGTRLTQIPKGFDKKDIPMKLGSGLLIHSELSILQIITFQINQDTRFYIHLLEKVLDLIQENILKELLQIFARFFKFFKNLFIFALTKTLNFPKNMQLLNYLCLMVFCKYNYQK